MLQVTVQQRQFLHKNRRELRLFVRRNNFKKLIYSHPCYPGSKSRQKHRRTWVEFSPLLQEVISASQKEFFLNSNSIQNSRWKPLCKCMFIFDTAFRKKQLFSPHFFLFWPSFCSLIRKPFLFSTVANYDGKIMILSQNKALKLIFYSSLPFPLQAMTSSLRLTSSFMNEQNFI